MALSIEQTQYLENHLQIIRSQLAFDESARLHYVNQLFELTKAELKKNDIILNEFENMVSELLRLLQKEVLEEKEDQHRFNLALGSWISQVKHKQQLDKEFTQSLTSSHARGIRATLCDGESAEKVWGNDDDIRVILRSVITHPDHVKESGCYILPPVMIVSGGLSAEQEQKTPHIFLENHFKDVVANKPKGDVILLAPVNSGQNHWMLVEAHVSNGELKSAVLRDSMKGSNNVVEKTDAFKNMSIAAKNVNASVKVSGVSDNKQSNGHSCMDYTIQTALQISLKNGADLDENQIKITQADSEKKLREEIVRNIILSDVKLAVKEKSVSDDVEALFKQEKANEEQIAKVLSKPKAVEVQKQFDELMASELDRLFKDPKNDFVSEKKLRDKARQFAFDTLKFKLFPPPTATNVSQSLDLSDSAKHKLQTKK